MKVFYFICFIVFLYYNGNSQANNLDSVCIICDTTGVRECGKRDVIKLKISNKKIKEDIKKLLRLQKYIFKGDTVFNYKFYKNLNVHYDKYGDSIIRVVNIIANYFSLNIYTVSISGIYFQGIQINKATTVKYGIDIPYYFDTRLIKQLIKKIRFPYLYNGCAQILINYINDYYGSAFSFKIPTKIPSGGHLAPSLLTQEYLKSIKK